MASVSRMGYCARCAVVFLALGEAKTAMGEFITHGNTVISMEFVTVGDPRNAADTEVMLQFGTTGYGRVDYTYRIGKYEVSKNQWDAVVGANTGDRLNDPGSWTGNQPVGDISWDEAAMFTNWLTSGDVTQGVYTIDANGVVTGVNRSSAQAIYGTIYFLPTEDEWYKAAYYDPNKPGGPGYWDYPTKHDAPNKPDGIDSAVDTVFDSVFLDSYNKGGPNEIDNAGVFSAYGTMGQGGNVWEWNETDMWGDGSVRGVRGGYWWAGDFALRSNYRHTAGFHANETDGFGFRVGSIEAVPEPGSAAACIAMVLTGLSLRRRRK